MEGKRERSLRRREPEGVRPAGRRAAAFDGRPFPLPGVRNEAPSGGDGAGLRSVWVTGFCFLFVGLVLDSEGLARNLPPIGKQVS